MSDENTNTDTVQEPTNLTMDQLKGVISDIMKKEGKGVVDEIKKEMDAEHRKQIIPDSNIDEKTGEAQLKDGSVVDFGFFNKALKQHGRLAPDGKGLGQQMLSMGGPFKTLSPEMQNCAKMFKMLAQKKYIEAADIIKENNGIVSARLKQAGMNEGILADGGALVATEFFTTIIEFATQASMVLGKIWRIPLNTNLMRLPRLVQAAGNYFGGITLYSPGEGEEKESSKPAYERLSLEPKKRIGLVYLTDELVADSFINLINYITGLYTRAFQYDMEAAVLNSAGGVAPCLGIIQDPAVNIVNRQTAGTIGYQDVVNMDNALDENFVDLSWMTRKVSQNTLLALRDTNNRPIFMADYGVFTGQPLHPNTMITYPVHRTRNIPAMGTQGDLVLGDLGWYILGIRQDLTIDLSEHVRFIYDEQTLRLVMRYDGMPAIPTAFAILGDVAS